MPITDRVNALLQEAHARNDPHWSLRFVTRPELDHMDSLLVCAGHPLAIEPGTQEARFVSLARAGHQFA